MNSRFAAYEWLMAVLALSVVPALILEEYATDPTLRGVALGTNWLVWIAFTAEFTVGLSNALNKKRFVRESWLDLLIILLSLPILPSFLQGTRTLRLLRVVRLFRAGAVLAIGLRSARKAFGRRKFHYVGVVAVAVVGLGAIGVYLVEGGKNKAIGSLGDALWWAIVTATTVGYGDVSPVTAEGRILAVLLMLTGIGVIGVFTATVASFFFEQQQEEVNPSVEGRLRRIEDKLDALITSADRSGRERL